MMSRSATMADRPIRFVKARSVQLQIGLSSLLQGGPEVSGIEWWSRVTLIKSREGQVELAHAEAVAIVRPVSSPASVVFVRRRFTLIDRGVNPAVERNYTASMSPWTISRRGGPSISDRADDIGEKAGKVDVEGGAGPVDSQDESRTPMTPACGCRTPIWPD